MATSVPLVDFETSLNELEALVNKMEVEQLTLEDALACFEKGIALTSYCQKALKEAELKVESIISQSFSDVSVTSSQED